MRLPSSKRGPPEVSGHKLEGAPVCRITNFTSHAQLNRHRIRRDLDLNRILSREYEEGRKRKEIKSIYCCSVTQTCPTLWPPLTARCQASLSFTISRSWLKLMSIESVMPSNRLVLRRPLLLPSIFSSTRIKSIHKGVDKTLTMESKVW